MNEILHDYLDDVFSRFYLSKNKCKIKIICYYSDYSVINIIVYYLDSVIKLYTRKINFFLYSCIRFFLTLGGQKMDFVASQGTKSALFDSIVEKQVFTSYSKILLIVGYFVSEISIRKLIASINDIIKIHIFCFIYRVILYPHETGYSYDLKI